MVYLLSEAFNVIGLKCTVIASFCGVGRTLCKQKYIQPYFSLMAQLLYTGECTEKWGRIKIGKFLLYVLPLNRTGQTDTSSH